MTNQVAIEALVKRETDKAILVACVGCRGERKEVWLPKSQVRREGNVIWVAAWLRDAKGGFVTLDPTIAAQMAA